MKLRRKRLISLAMLLAVAILAIGLVSTGCIRGVAPVGWSGGTVSNNSTLFVGSSEGRLVAINLTDESRQLAEPLTAVTQSGLFGCAPAGGGCGTAVPRVAIYGTPVVADDLVYIAGYNGKIYAYNVSNLAARWVYPREGNLQPFVGGLVLAQGKLIVGSSDGKVYALDSTTGDKKWEFATGDKIWATPAIDGDTVYIGSFDKKLYALNVSDGSKKWEFVTGGAIISTPLVHNGTIYIGSFDRNLYAVSAINGNLKWKFTGESWFWAEPVVYSDNIYAGCLDGNVYVLKADTGEKVKGFQLKSGVSSRPVIVDSSVIVAARGGIIYSIDTASQEIKQIVDIKTDIDGPLTAYEGIVYIHTQALELQRINAVSGALLRPISLKS